MTVPFGDLKTRYQQHRAAVDAAVRRVLERGWFVLGPELEAFESEFAASVGSAHCVGVGNGTSAIELALRALGVGPGDEVVTVAHTATFTALGIAATGATPVFVDVDEGTQTMSAEALQGVLGERTRAVVPVHLYGTPADVPALRAVLAPRGVPIVEDAAQAHGARLAEGAVGTLGAAACFSFYPSKNLGAFGDGGAITTSDAALAERVRVLRNGGQADRYTHTLVGVNSRLDELQAAILRAFLPELPAMNARRRAIAERYCRELAGLPRLVLPPPERPGSTSAWHLFVVRHPARDALKDALASRGVQALVHYPTPSHLQPAFGPPRRPLPVTERLANEVLSLPLHPELDDEQVATVIAAVRDATAALG
jgi:dTDP-3-amino-3,4,6-trideoxy-alpha-D-glucose transaminase